MPRIFDNVENSLSLYNVLLTSLETASHADFCVGYFRLAAWRKIASLIEKFSGGEAACCRLLVGMEKDSIEVVDPLVKEDFADALLQFRDQIQSKKGFY